MDHTATKPNIQPGDVIALGDIHGVWELYERFLEDVDGTGAVVVLLGDMIDRGGEELKVLEATRDRLQAPEDFGLEAFYALKGNHEKMFLDACDLEATPYALWVQNGGNAEDFMEMRREHWGWIQTLPVYLTIGETLFVHAGIAPGHDPKQLIEQKKADYLMWVRQPFLAFGPEFQEWNPRLKLAVHGHTPMSAPEFGQQRLCIDTGACFEDGYLTAYNVTQNTFYYYSRE